jgi:hypothetical protein
VVATQFYKRRHDPWSWAQYPLSCRCELRSCLVLCDATPRADWWAALEVLEVKRDFRAVPFMLTGASTTGVALPTPSKPTTATMTTRQLAHLGTNGSSPALHHFVEQHYSDVQ